MSSTPRKPKEEAKYANVFRVGYNTFEFLLEFGQRGGRAHTAIYMSPQHTKMFSDLLLCALTDQEAEHFPKLPSILDTVD